MKPQVFIGSSSESVHIAEIVVKVLEPECECTIWKKGFFELNKSTYDNLVEKSICFDYAVFVGGTDDLVERSSTGEKKVGIRDNVYLELGLYGGILSKDRSYFLVHDSCRVASDLMGLTLLYYGDEKQAKECSEDIKKKIEKEEKLSRITLLPSTSLAFGYYENFLRDASREVKKLKEVEIDDKVYNVEDMEKQIAIILPDTVEEDWKEWAEGYYEDHVMREIIFKHSEGLPKSLTARVDMEALNNQGIFRVIDIPMTLRASFSSIDLIAGKSYYGEDEEFQRAKKKEVKNFEKTLEIFLKKDHIAKRFVHIEH